MIVKVKKYMLTNRMFKRIGTLLLTIAVLFSLLAPSFATSAFAGDNGEYETVNAEELSDAYITFSEKLADMGISANTCFEDFVSGYESVSESLQLYVQSLIEAEITNTINHPDIGSHNTIDDIYIEAMAARDTSTLSEKGIETLEAYEEMVSAFSERKIGTYPPYAAFVDAYEMSEADSAQEYANAIILASEEGAYSTRSSMWQDNIGTSSPALPQEASYSDYNILSKVKKGDIVEETSGGVAALTGHIAIVQGKYWDSTYQQYYIRLIEAGVDGVVYGVLDDTRYDNRGINIYYVTSATSTQKTDAVDFCLDQLGKDYNWVAILNSSNPSGILYQCQSSSNSSSWYCSELVWAAYYNQGINLNGSYIPYNIYYPSTLASSSKLTYRSVE